MSAIHPSILSADAVHVDVMDNHFVAKAGADTEKPVTVSTFP